MVGQDWKKRTKVPDRQLEQLALLGMVGLEVMRVEDSKNPHRKMTYYRPPTSTKKVQGQGKTQTKNRTRAKTVKKGAVPPKPEVLSQPRRKSNGDENSKTLAAK